MAPTVPTCASPSFIIGIPKCAITAQNIFSISVKGNQVGLSTLSFSALKVIGAGSNVSSIWQGGAYNIVAAAVQTTEPNPTITPAPEPTATQNVEQPVITEEAQTPAGQATPENNIPTGVGAADLSAIASGYFWPLFIILIIFAVGYGIYYLIKRKKK
jgi:hypothetical protein